MKYGCDSAEAKNEINRLVAKESKTKWNSLMKTFNFKHPIPNFKILC